MYAYIHKNRQKQTKGKSEEAAWRRARRTETATEGPAGLAPVSKRATGNASVAHASFRVCFSFVFAICAGSEKVHKSQIRTVLCFVFS